MTSGRSSSSRAEQILFVAAAALFVAPAIAAGCGTTVARAGSASTGTGGASVTSTSTASVAGTTTGTGGHAAATSSSGTGTGGGLGDAGDAGGSGGSGSGGGAEGDAGDAGDAAVQTTTTLNPGDAPLPGQSTCQVVEVTNIPEPDFNHITPCTPISYPSPPSGGNHWPIWGAYKIYTEALPREMYVHDLEHGAIVLTYNCAGPCPAVVAALTQVFDSMSDPECLTLGGPLARMVVTPDPLLTTPIAASAWGATYTATCIDIPSLQAFANAHYGQGREDLCNDGQDNESDPLCPDGGS